VSYNLVMPSMCAFTTFTGLTLPVWSQQTRRQTDTAQCHPHDMSPMQRLPCQSLCCMGCDVSTSIACGSNLLADRPGPCTPRLPYTLWDTALRDPFMVIQSLGRQRHEQWRGPAEEVCARVYQLLLLPLDTSHCRTRGSSLQLTIIQSLCVDVVSWHLSQCVPARLIATEPSCSYDSLLTTPQQRLHVTSVGAAAVLDPPAAQPTQACTQQLPHTNAAAVPEADNAASSAHDGLSGPAAAAAAQAAAGGMRLTHVPVEHADSLSYTDFVARYMAPNLPVLIKVSRRLGQWGCCDGSLNMVARTSKSKLAWWGGMVGPDQGGFASPASLSPSARPPTPVPSSLHT